MPKAKIKTRVKIKSVHTFELAGIEHQLKSRQQQFAFFESAFKGMEFQIKREPKNKADKNACAVFYEQKKIGYVPRKMAETMAPMIDAGDSCLWFLSDFLFSTTEERTYSEVKITCLQLDVS